MKRGMSLVLLALLASISIGWLLHWKNVIEPKNTRLAFYEIATASKYHREDPSTASQLSSWLGDLDDLKESHLQHCERIQYQNLNASLERRLKRSNLNPALTPTSLQKAAKKYLLDTPSLETLLQIGQAEFESVMSEIKLFEAELKNQGFSGTLNELGSGLIKSSM